MQVLALLGLAKTLGALSEAINIPSIAGEIMAGVILGPTILGRISPSFQSWLFAMDKTQLTMLETVSWLGVFFLLLSSGFHVNVREALRSGKSAIFIGIIGVLVPIAIGFPIFLLLDDSYWGEKANSISFALFLAVAGSITAISVVARALGDLKINQTQHGSLALSACAVNDLFGWFLFTVVISLVTSKSMSAIELILTALGVIGFVFVTISFGSRIFSGAVKLVKSTSLDQSTAIQTLIVSAGLLCGAITQWLGIHAILGFFLAGIMVGSAKGVSMDMRNSVSDTLHAIFVPLFFATLGLKIDFLLGLEFWPTLIFTLVAVFGKFIGAWLGAFLSRENSKTSVLMGLIFMPGGAMEIVVATLALELQLIGQTIFVAIVFAALLSSMITGPLIGFQSRKMGILISNQLLSKK